MQRKPRGTHRALITTALLLGAGIPLASLAADAAIEQAYQRQFQDLAPDDVAGHVTLAEWCRDQQAWDLLTKQCSHVLNLDPNHARAKLLLKLARSRLGASGGSGPSAGAAAAGGSSAPTPAGKVRLLTDEQVQTLRRKELKLDRAERITVKFKNDVLERFWADWSVRQGLGRRDQTTYNKMHPAQKAQLILGKVKEYERAATEERPFNDIFSEDIEITNDPMIFKEYKTGVWPIMQKGCATSKCHGGPNAAGFSLYNERVMTDNMHYTNYLILHEYDSNGRRLVNRDHPQQSLLLLYGQPVGGDRSTAHPVDISVLYRTPRDPKYRTILNWVGALDLPAPDYGFSLEDLK